jgi:hypothetical protein
MRELGFDPLARSRAHRVTPFIVGQQRLSR